MSLKLTMDLRGNRDQGRKDNNLTSNEGHGIIIRTGACVLCRTTSTRTTLDL